MILKTFKRTLIFSLLLLIVGCQHYYINNVHRNELNKNLPLCIIKNEMTSREKDVFANSLNSSLTSEHKFEDVRLLTEHQNIDGCNYFLIYDFVWNLDLFIYYIRRGYIKIYDKNRNIIVSSKIEASNKKFFGHEAPHEKINQMLIKMFQPSIFK